ncbi:MAG: YetF domain-containing protein [Anaerobutyricum soehngenii]
MQCRSEWIFDLKELQTAILEENGRISFLAKIRAPPCLHRRT